MDTRSFKTETQYAQWHADRFKNGWNTMQEKVETPKQHQRNTTHSAAVRTNGGMKLTPGFSDNRQEARNQNQIQRVIAGSSLAQEELGVNNQDPVVQRTSWSWLGGVWVAQPLDEGEPQTPMPGHDGSYEWETIDTNGEEEAGPPGLAADYASPYTGLMDNYSTDLRGAVVRVEENFVVIVEHYQLKHNPDLGLLQAGGPFLGKKGSQLGGGWGAHTNTYSVEVLEAARAIIASLAPDVALPIAPKKQRLASIEAYISINKDGEDWIINYHGNPPE
ncbi:MAG: hypothetical protein COB04_02465 [Gammaproteobacteria bacterium]|nr:MAG: hypothetical protein COB04_02465 [Gammaproteobacteria bacterium]